MVKLDDAVLAKLKRDDSEFEIFVDPYLAWDFKHGKDINFDDMIAYEAIYADAKKGEEASADDLNKAFGTTEFEPIAKEIIKNGDVQLTTAQKQEMTENRRKEIINYLSKNAHDPKNKTPIPEQRLINAFEELKIKVDLSKSREREIQEIIEKLIKIMPISLDKITVSVEIPGTHAGKASSVIYKYEIADQKWLPSGGLMARVKIPSGMKNQLVSDLNNVTHGNVTIKVEDEK